MYYTRREFLKKLGLISGSAMLIPVLPSCSSPERRFRVLTDEEASCLEALCERIIPADGDPGATDAGVIYFIDKQAATRFPAERGLFGGGVRSLQAYCNDRYGADFEKLDADTQIAVMESLERGELPVGYWGETDQRDFFSRLVKRTMQGFYGSPRHGGNRNYVSYRMLKLDYPLVVGQNRYK